jgi:hypothetical protein
MFARSPNHFSESEADSRPLTEESFKARLQYLTNIVYPAVKEKINEVNTRRAEYFSKSHRIISSDEFQPGALVMAVDELRSNKTAPRYTGPFMILGRSRGGAYRLKGPDGTLYSRPPSSLKLVSAQMEFNDHSAEVDYIVDHRRDRSGTAYLVKWKNSPSTAQEWIMDNAFDNQNPITVYWKTKSSGTSQSKPLIKIKFKSRS